MSKSFREGGSETRVLHGLALELARGETTSLVGSSGSGKSTLISLLAGLLLPDAGTLRFDGRAHRVRSTTASARACAPSASAWCSSATTSSRS